MRAFSVLGEGISPPELLDGMGRAFLPAAPKDGVGWIDSGGLGSERTSSRMCSQWHLLVDVKQLQAHLAKIKEGMNECFPFLSGNFGEITEVGVSWVVFSPLLL